MCRDLRSKSFVVRKPSSPTLLTTPGPVAPKELMRRSMSRPERGPDLAQRDMLVRPPHVDEEAAVRGPSGVETAWKQLGNSGRKGRFQVQCGCF